MSDLVTRARREAGKRDTVASDLLEELADRAQEQEATIARLTADRQGMLRTILEREGERDRALAALEAAEAARDALRFKAEAYEETLDDIAALVGVTRQQGGDALIAAVRQLTGARDALQRERDELLVSVSNLDRLYLAARTRAEEARHTYRGFAAPLRALALECVVIGQTDDRLCHCEDIDFTDWPSDLRKACGFCRVVDAVERRIRDAFAEGLSPAVGRPSDAGEQPVVPGAAEQKPATEERDALLAALRQLREQMAVHAKPLSGGAPAALVQRWRADLSTLLASVGTQVQEQEQTHEEKADAR